MSYASTLMPAVLIALTLGCTATPGDTPPASQSNSDPGQSSASTTIADTLRKAGLEVTDAGTVQQPFFTVPAHVILVDGNDLQIYEFGTAEEAEHAASQVAPNGGSIGTTMMSWMAPPHFFRKERVIANYLGSNEKTLAELQRLFGAQFAGR